MRFTIPGPLRRRHSWVRAAMAQRDQAAGYLWCTAPSHRYFCAKFIEGPKFPRFLSYLVEMLLL